MFSNSIDETIIVALGTLLSVLASAFVAWVSLRRVKSQNYSDESSGSKAAAESTQILLGPLNARILALEAEMQRMNGTYHLSLDLTVGENPTARIISISKAGSEMAPVE